MDEWSATEITAAIAAVGSLITVIIGALFSEKVAAVLKQRAEWKAQQADRRRQELEKNRLLDEKGHKQVIRLLDDLATELQTRCDKLGQEHLECQVKLAETNTKLLECTNRLGEMIAKYDQLQDRVKTLENHAA